MLKFAVFILLVGAISSTPLKPRFSLARDDANKFHMVDIEPIIDEEPSPAFDAEQDVFFMLFTRSNPIEGQRITPDMMSILNSNFNPSLEVRILIHGWLGSFTSQENPRTTADFLRRADYNVIVVDWNAGAAATLPVARWRIGEVGVVVARFVDWLSQHGFTQHSKVNLVGHSLGSHLAGHVGKAVTLGKINAIFGTDPAGGDLFSINDPDNRLAEDDAVYTEAIVTNTGILIEAPIAHANFYPNYGATQPGCLIWTCSHHRGTEFYGESINSNLFIARQCVNKDEILAENCPGTGTTAMMGGDFAKNIRGVFFLETRASSPFAMG